MSAELLKFPSLSLQYFKTVTLVCELYPDKICYLNTELQKNLFASLELGLTGIGVDTVFNLSCEFLQVLCVFIRGTKKNDLPIMESLKPFLKVRTRIIIMYDRIKNREIILISLPFLIFEKRKLKSEKFKK